MLYQVTPSAPIIDVYTGHPSNLPQDGKMGTFLTSLRSLIQAQYGLSPVFVVSPDADASADAVAWGVAPWTKFGGPLYTSNTFNGKVWGYTSAGSRKSLYTVWLNDWNPSTNKGTPCPPNVELCNSSGDDYFESPYDSNGNSILYTNYSDAAAAGTYFIQNEGFYDFPEGEPLTPSYAFGNTIPHQHLSATRQYADPTTNSMMFEAEGADEYYKVSVHTNLGGTYRNQWYTNTGLDVYEPLHNMNPWATHSTEAPGTLVSLSAGFFDVWALDNVGQIWDHGIADGTTANTWKTVGMNGIPKFTQLALGKHDVWALNGTTVYTAELPYSFPSTGHTTWTAVSGTMIQLSVDEAEVWAVDASGLLYNQPVNALQNPGGTWSQVAGPGPALNSVYVGGNSKLVWAMSGSNIYYTTKANISWTSVPNPYNLTSLSVGSQEVWGVNAAGNVYRRSISGIGNWVAVAGSFSQIAVGENYAWALQGATPSSLRLTGFLGAPAAVIPNTPTGFLVTVGPSGQTTMLNWTASAGAAGYNVKRATTSGGPYTTMIMPTANTATDTGLAGVTTYYYVVSAFNALGESANSQEVTVTTPGFIITPTATTSAVVSGASVSDSISIVSVVPFAGTVNLSCAISNAVPPNTATGTCSVTPSVVLGSGGSAPATLKINTTAGTSGILNATVTGTNGTSVSSAVVPVDLTASSFTPLANSQASAALQISAGGAGYGTWSADEYFSGGTVGTAATAGVNTLLDPRPAPQSVYQHNRFGAMTYTITGLTANAAYAVDLHFAETSFNAAGEREFNVLINSAQVMTNFDIFAVTGGENMAILKSFPAIANGSGQIVIQFTVGAASNPQINGIEILPNSTFLTPGGIYTLTSRTSGLNLDNENSYTASNDVYQWASTVGDTNQQWQINLLPNGYYNLINLSSGMALDNAGSTTVGTWFTQYDPGTNNPNQEFTITPLGDGYYKLVVAKSGMALDNSGATANGGEVHQWGVANGNPNQEWQIVPVQTGANTPFTSYEAETGTMSGGATVVSLATNPTTEFSSPALEASGHAYVNLSASGESVTWTNNTGQNITAINVRYSIPDSSTGGGIASTLDLYVNGTFRQALNVNSAQTWVYETSSSYGGMNQNPSSGNAYVFWDEVHTFITGAPVAPGSTITLQKDSANSASYYNIDVVDLENPLAALTEPTNFLSLTTDCGAVANSPSTDSTAALRSCISEAQSQGKGVWIPIGTFYIKTASTLSPTGITIAGAGMWYSIIYWDPPLPLAASLAGIFQPTSCVLQNFAIDGEAMDSTYQNGNTYAVNIKGSNWVINSLWLSHEGPGIWADGSNGIIQNSRINNSWAGGININNGNGGTNNNTGNNITVLNNFVRGSGGDGYALNEGSLGLTMQGNNLLNNTDIAPWWGSNIAIYGGESTLVANNLTQDAVMQYGISVGLFGGQGILSTTQVQGNTVLRPGGFGYAKQFAGVGVGVSSAGPSNTAGMVIRGNSIDGAMFNGMQIYIGQSMIVSNNGVNSPQGTGFTIDSTAVGSANIICNTALNLHAGQSAFIDNASNSNFTVSGSCNNFTVP